MNACLNAYGAFASHGTEGTVSACLNTPVPIASHMFVLAYTLRVSDVATIQDYIYIGKYGDDKTRNLAIEIELLCD